MIGLLLAAVALTSGIGACSSKDAGPPSTTTSTAGGSDESAADDADLVFPGREWDRVDPTAAGFDPDALEEIAGQAAAGGSHCMVVTRQGRLVGEWYWNGTEPTTQHEVFSVTKSITSTLVGIAQDDGLLDIDDPASDLLTEWADGPSEDVTVRNLLSNDSGREWSMALDYGGLIAAADKAEFALGLGQDHEPGTVWAYNNSAIQALEVVLVRATDQDGVSYAREHLFEPIGMTRSALTPDPAGHARFFMGLRSTCRDLARFGHLFLADGRWSDEQVVSSDWVREATSPSQELTSSYGFLWWLNRPGPLASATVATEGPAASGGDDGRLRSGRTEPDMGQLVEGAPADMYWARGFGGQIVAVDPGSQTVAVRLAPAVVPEGTPTFDSNTLAEVVTRALVDP